MIEPHWKKIAGISCLDNGDKGAVWMALDTDTDTLRIYDCCIFRQHQILLVVAESFTSRGRHTPVAWDSKSQPIADELDSRGVTMLDPIKDSPALTEAYAAAVKERMLTHRLTVSDRLKDWHTEYDDYFRDDAVVPVGGYPLMTATRYAVGCLSEAKRERAKGAKQRRHMEVAIV